MFDAFSMARTELGIIMNGQGTQYSIFADFSWLALVPVSDLKSANPVRACRKRRTKKG
jgi:hypothetical protein